MSSPDRLARDYEPRFDIDFKVGEQGELYVLRIIESLKDGRVEVKTDEAAEKYGNVYVEYECQYRGEWKRSGIAVTEAQLWAFVIGEVAIVAPTERVKEVARFYGRFKAHRRSCKVGSHPTRGVTIPLRELVRLLAYGAPEARA